MRIRWNAWVLHTYPNPKMRMAFFLDGTATIGWKDRRKMAGRRTGATNKNSSDICIRNEE